MQAKKSYIHTLFKENYYICNIMYSMTSVNINVWRVADSGKTAWEFSSLRKADGRKRCEMIPARWFSKLSRVLNTSSDSQLDANCSSTSVVCVCMWVYILCCIREHVWVCFPAALGRCGPQQGVNIANATMNLYTANLKKEMEERCISGAWILLIKSLGLSFCMYCTSFSLTTSDLKYI